MAAPSHRARGKSAPRGKSPDPKALKKALKVQQKSKSGLVTPNKPSSNSSRSSTPVTPKKLSFAEHSRIHPIKAENPPGKGFEDETMKGEKADAIIAAMRKETAAKEQRKKKAAAAANSSSSDEEHEAPKAKSSKEPDVKVKSKKEQKGETLKQPDDDEEPRKRKGDAERKTGPRKAQKQEPKEKSEKPKESKKRKEEKEKEEARQKEEEEREAAAKMKAAKEESEKEHRGNAKSKAKKAKAEKVQAEKAKAEQKAKEDAEKAAKEIAKKEKAKAEQKAKEDAEKAAKEIAKKEKEQKAQAEKAMKAKAEKEKEKLALEDAKNMKPVSLLKKKEATESEDEEEEDSNSNDSEGSSEGESEEEASQLESDSDHEEESQEKSSDNEEVSEGGSEDEDQEEEEEEEGSVSESSQGETNSEGEDSDGKGEMGSEEESGEKETKVDTGVKRKLCEEESKAPSEATEKTKGEKKREKKEAKKEAKKALKDAEKSLAKKGIKVKNSTKFRKEWQAFTRYLKNPTRCPAKVIAACKNKETRHQLFQDYVETNRDTAQVEARFEARLEETQRTQIRYGFRNDQWLIKHHGERKATKIMARKRELGLTIPDPESPGDEDEKLFFVMVELNMDDIRELRRVTQIEMQGSLDADGVKAFVEAGGCLDGKQHLSIEGLSGATGMKTLANAIGTAAPSGDAEKKPGKGGKGKKNKKEGEKETTPPKVVVPDTPISEAQGLLARVLKDANNCRDHAFKLRPLALSSYLIDQLKACAVKLGHQADALQNLISKGKNKNKNYADLIAEVEDITKHAKERVDLAKALIRASEKPAKSRSRSNREAAGSEKEAAKEATTAPDPAHA